MMNNKITVIENAIMTFEEVKSYCTEIQQHAMYTALGYILMPNITLEDLRTKSDLYKNHIFWLEAEEEELAPYYDDIVIRVRVEVL